MKLTPAGNRSRFSNTVKVEWPNGFKREMRLLEDVSFIDNKGVVWTAHKGDLIDGASIPRAFWAMFGSPFVGLYRRPSVIHDVYCKSKEKPFADTHQMFYEACLSDGVGRKKAMLAGQAVKRFGPRW